MTKHILDNSPKKTIVIAIDGHSACGKSTIAKDLAKALDYTYIDTGAMYRAITYLLMKSEISLEDSKGIQIMLEDIQMEFRKVNDHRELFVNGTNVEQYIRTPDVAAFVSPVSEISQIRRKLVSLQRQMAEGESVILEGRDIGTVVFPNADIKFFITADTDTRTKRRLDELINKNITATFSEVKHNLQERDRIDSSRIDSPLKQADDAILIDTTDHDRDSQLQFVLDLVEAHVFNVNEKENGF